MAIVLKDRVKETTTTTGTGTLTLTGAVAGYQSFDAIGNGSQTYYTIVDNENNAWEVGFGTFTASGRTLTRSAILSSSSAGAAVNFAAGTKDVFVTYPAEKAIYEENTGNVLVDGGPITVVGTGVTGYTTFSAALGEFYGNVNSFAQLYAQNYSDGSEAAGDLVVYRNDALNDMGKFVDMGINSSNYSSATYPIFSAGSAYLFNDGGELFVGSATDDVVIFAGGVDTTDEAVRIDKTTKAMTTVGGVNVGAALDVTGAATFGSTVLLNANPTLDLQAATKQYVDNAVSAGLTIHTPVRLERGSNLNATYNNGTAGVGATLTNAGAKAALVLDGITTNTNDRILVYGQTAAAENGVYTVTTVGDGSTDWVLTRATDADTYGTNNPTKLDEGAYFYVTSGNTGAGESYVVATVGTITFGITAITFNQFSASPTYTGTAPIAVTGQVISLSGVVPATNGGTGTDTITTGDLLYGSGTNTWGKLAAGAAYKSLVMNAGGTNVAWNAVALDQSAAVSGALGATNGGTGFSGYTLGDIIYSSATDTLAKLAGNTTTTKKFLVQTGTGAVSTAPVWGTISGSDVTGAITGQAGSVANALTFGTYLTGTSYNGGSAVTVTVDATSANTVSKVVARDASGNFSAGTITATLSGAATSAGTATNVAGGAANRLLLQSSANTTTFADAPSASGTYLNWNGAALAWGTVVSSAVAGTGVSVSAASGAVTFSIGQAVATSSNVQFNSLGIGTAASGTAGEIRATNNVTAYYSDERLKTKVGDIENPLSKVRQIETMLYHANETAVALGYDASIIEVGVTAQSVQRSQPEAVAPAPIDEKYLTVRYERLVPLLIEAVKVLEDRIIMLEASKEA